MPLRASQTCRLGPQRNLTLLCFFFSCFLAMISPSDPKLSRLAMPCCFRCFKVEEERWQSQARGWNNNDGVAMSGQFAIIEIQSFDLAGCLLLWLLLLKCQLQKKNYYCSPLIFINWTGTKSASRIGQNEIKYKGRKEHLKSKHITPSSPF